MNLSNQWLSCVLGKECFFLVCMSCVHVFLCRLLRFALVFCFPHGVVFYLMCTIAWVFVFETTNNHSITIGGANSVIALRLTTDARVQSACGLRGCDMMVEASRL